MKPSIPISIGLWLICLQYIPVHSQIVKLPSTQGYIQTEDSVQLFYKMLGEGEDTLVIVHGGPYNSGYLMPDLTPLAAHHSLLFYDLRGAGYSSFVDDTAKLGITDHVRDIETIRKYFHLQKLNLLAHSTGGIISGFYAVANPQRINSMILINPMTAKAGWNINFENKLDSTSLLIKRQNAGHFYTPPADTLKACWDFYALEARGYFPSPVHVRRMWGAICNCNQSNMLNPKRWYVYQSMGNWDITAQLAKVKAPVLIIAGEEDEIPLGSFEQWNHSLPNSKLLKFPEAAHFPHVDQPNAFFMAVELFMKNKVPDESVLEVTGAGIILKGDDEGTPYQKGRAAVIRVENELVRLVNQADWEGVSAIYAEDATILPPGAPPVYGRQAIASFWHTAAIRGMHSIELQLMDLEISGDLLHGRGKYVMRGQQHELIDVGKFIAIYRKENHLWILQTDIFNSSMETRSPIEVPDYLMLQKN